MTEIQDCKFVRREIDTLKKSGNEFIPEKRCIIGVSMNGIIIPHPITDFIDKKYYLQSGSINSERAASDCIVQFFNFVIDQCKNSHSAFESVKGINDLKLSHLECYLECCGELGNNRNTVNRKESYLLQFYYFIGIEKNKLKTKPDIKINNSSFSNNERNIRRIKKLEATLYYKKPPKVSIETSVIKKKDFLTQRWTSLENKRNIRLQFIREFLLLASKESPDIAFAICLQIFGGLRAAECMNLNTHALKPYNNSKYAEEGLVIEIRDRQSILFDSKSILSNEQVKKPRDQAILLDPLVPYLYKKHLDWLNIKRRHPSIRTNSKFTNEISLFLNNSGNPMKTHTYRSKFRDLKNLYLGLLKATEGRYEDFNEFRKTKWSTHICRGAFTNLCLDSGFNAIQTAIMRGDSSPEAMFAYTDILTASSKVTQAINIISENASNSDIELQKIGLIKTWQEVLDFGKNK